MSEAVPDRIEKQIVLKAPRARVWQALTNAPEFGRWFGARLDGATFAVGQMENIRQHLGDAT